MEEKYKPSEELLNKVFDKIDEAEELIKASRLPKPDLNEEHTKIIGDQLAKSWNELSKELGFNVTKNYHFYLYNTIINEIRFWIMTYRHIAEMEFKSGTDEYNKRFDEIFENRFEEDMDRLIEIAKSLGEEENE